jgi:hypothetical protein
MVQRDPSAAKSLASLQTADHLGLGLFQEGHLRLSDFSANGTQYLLIFRIKGAKNALCLLNQVCYPKPTNLSWAHYSHAAGKGCQVVR